MPTPSEPYTPILPPGSTLVTGWDAQGPVDFVLTPTAPPPAHEPEGMPFMVDTIPHAMWDHSAREKNVAYLAGVDPDFFEHLAKVHAPLLGSENKKERQHAATAIRLAYSMALETFCALLAASIQAPRFPLGWMLIYENKHLMSVMGKLHRGEPVHNGWSTDTSWNTVANTILRFSTDKPDYDRAVKEGYAKLWKRFAGEYLDDAATKEYNSIKHGLRAKSGGFRLSVGHAGKSGAAPRPEAMTPPSGSEFGSQFFIKQKARKRAWTVDHATRNWVPDNLLNAIQLLKISTVNLLSFLRRQAGDAENAPNFAGPADIREFDAPWRRRLAFEFIREISSVTADRVSEWTDEEISAVFPVGPKSVPNQNKAATVSSE